jgi:hypothetical protein
LADAVVPFATAGIAQFAVVANADLADFEDGEVILAAVLAFAAAVGTEEVRRMGFMPAADALENAMPRGERPAPSRIASDKLRPAEKKYQKYIFIIYNLQMALTSKPRGIKIGRVNLYEIKIILISVKLFEPFNLINSANTNAIPIIIIAFC